MREMTVYLIVKAKVQVVDDNTSNDDIVSRVSQDCDYIVSHEDDICKIVETELIDASTEYHM